jgi:hypothetical protein
MIPTNTRPISIENQSFNRANRNEKATYIEVNAKALDAHLQLTYHEDVKHEDEY